jgi:hypothetical protein
MIAPPKPSNPPFAWQDKRILQRILQQCEDPASAIGVYVALTVAASDLERDEFQTTHKWLASICGFCEKTVRNRLADLQRIGAVSITTPAMRAPCTYRLLPFGNSCRTSGNGCRAFGNGSALSVTEIRSTTTVQQQHGKNGSSKAAKLQLSPEWLSDLGRDLAYKELNVEHELSKAQRWCDENSRQCTRRFFVNWLNRCRPRTTLVGAVAAEPLSKEDILRAAL